MYNIVIKRKQTDMRSGFNMINLDSIKVLYDGVMDITGDDYSAIDNFFYSNRYSNKPLEYLFNDLINRMTPKSTKELANLCYDMDEYVSRAIYSGLVNWGSINSATDLIRVGVRLYLHDLLYFNIVEIAVNHAITYLGETFTSLLDALIGGNKINLAKLKRLLFDRLHNVSKESDFRGIDVEVDRLVYDLLNECI